MWYFYPISNFNLIHPLTPSTIQMMSMLESFQPERSPSNFKENKRKQKNKQSPSSLKDSDVWLDIGKWVGIRTFYLTLIFILYILLNTYTF